MSFTPSDFANSSPLLVDVSTSTIFSPSSLSLATSGAAFLHALQPVDLKKKVFLGVSLHSVAPGGIGLDNLSRAVGANFPRFAAI